MNFEFKNLKKQMKDYQDQMRKKLTKLTVESDQSLLVVKEKSEKVFKKK
jgi:hypothetical protein